MLTSALSNFERSSFRAARPRPRAGAQPTAAALRVVPGSRWVTAYGLLLHLLIAVYFGMIAAAIFLLLDLQSEIMRDLGRVEGLWFLWVNLAFLLLFPLTRLALHLWRGMVGLVTQQHDAAPERSIGVVLPPEQHPELYAAVAEVGELVRSPRPDEIRLSYRAECFALEQRAFGLSTDRSLILVIGLPQLEVLTLSELKVIVAHELAHFGGGDTRLGVFVFRFLKALRLAQEENAHSGWRWIDPVAWLSWLYYHLFVVLSAPLRRHQELRADGWSAAAYGGEFAAVTLLRDWILAQQFDDTLTHFLRAVPRKVAGDGSNLFREFSARFHDLTPEGLSYLEQRLAQEEQPSFWDSHPTIRERMTNMRRYVARDLPEPLPAYLLVRDIDAMEHKLQEQLNAQLPAFP